MDDGEHLEFTWRVHPARERLGAALAGLAAVLALAGLSAVLMRSPWWGVLAVAVLLVGLNRFFLPSRFAIDAEGITARYPLQRRRLRWADLRRVVHDDRAVFLSTRSRPARVGASRGVQVLFGEVERESVLARIRAHLPQGVVSWAL